MDLNNTPSPIALFDSPRGGTFAPIGRLSYAWKNYVRDFKEVTNLKYLFFSKMCDAEFFA